MTTCFFVPRFAASPVRPPRALVKASDTGAFIEAARLVEEVSARCADARADAYRNALEAGEAEAGARTAALITETCAALVRELDASRAMLAGVVTQAVRRIVAGFDDDVLVGAIVDGLLEEAKGAHRVRVHVAPARVAPLRARLPGDVDVVADVELDAAVCRVETPSTFFRASPALSLAAFERALCVPSQVPGASHVES